MTTFDTHTEHKQGATITGTFNPPAGSIKDTHVSSSSADRIAAGKTQHQKTFTVDTDPAVAVSASDSRDYLRHRAVGAGTVTDFNASLEAAITGAYTYTIDLQKATDGSNTFSSVLTSTITLDNATAADTKVAATVDSTKADYVADDRFKIVVTRAGASGTDGQGLLVAATVNENPS